MKSSSFPGLLPPQVLFGYEGADKLLIQLKQEGQPVAVAGEFPLGISRINGRIQLLVGLDQSGGMVRGS